MMGAKLVAAAFRWRTLPDKPFRLLAHMALTCLDNAKQPNYYGGRDALAEALGLPAKGHAGCIAPANSTSKEDCPVCELSYRSVKRCIKVLVDAGAISRGYQGHGGKRSEYVLHVRNNPDQGATQSPPQGTSQSTPRGPLSGTAGDHSVAPLGTTNEGTKEHGRKNSSTSKGESPTRAGGDEAKPMTELSEWEKQRRARQIAKAREKRVSPLDELKAQRAGGATA